MISLLYLLSIKMLLIIIGAAIVVRADIDPFSTYRTKYLDVLNPACGSVTSRDHIMCNLLTGPVDGCPHFELFEMDTELKRRIIAGHNGLRNMEAKRIGYEIANMNLLHWDDDLAEMARQRIFRCGHIEYGNEVYISNPNFTVGNNTFYMKGFPGYKKWLSIAIHSWFNHSTVNKPAQFSEDATFTPYIQLIWPQSEFVGCAGARANLETRFICFYGPRAVESNISAHFVNQRWCTQCPPTRTTCSLIFEALCGIDLFSTSNGNQPNLYLIFFVLIGLIEFSNK